MGDETALYADAAYSSEETRDKLERLGIADHATKGLPSGWQGITCPISKTNPSQSKRQQTQRPLSVAGGERPFTTFKSRYGLPRTRFMGLAKNMTAYGIAAIAYNLRKGAKFLTLCGLPDPNYAG